MMFMQGGAYEYSLNKICFLLGIVLKPIFHFRRVMILLYKVFKH